jgi:methylated-DNA-protein-cysteine methyltransferase-like protein
MSKFKKAVYKVVRLIPSGKVVSYGQVALYVGVPRGARQVGWILNKSKESDMIPWWRVVNNKGRISIKGFRCSAEEQRQLLVQEGLKIRKDFTFDIEEYRFRPDEKFIDKLELDPFYLHKILSKIPFL